MTEIELRLKDFGGQNCDVVLYRRRDGSKFASFLSNPQYGSPSLDEAKLTDLLQRLKELK